MQMARKGKQNETASLSPIAWFLSHPSWFLLGPGRRAMFHGWSTELTMTESHRLLLSSGLTLWCSNISKKGSEYDLCFTAVVYYYALHSCSFLTEESSLLFVCGDYLHVRL